MVQEGSGTDVWNNGDPFRFAYKTLTGTVTGSWQVAAIGMAMPTNDAAPLYLTVTDKAGKAKTVVNANPSATTATAWTQWQIPFSSLTGVSLTTVQKITLGPAIRPARNRAPPACCTSMTSGTVTRSSRPGRLPCCNL